MVYKELIKHAVLAPSGHNTQPWKFKPIQNGIEIFPDFSRSLDIVDPDNHALYISLGCAAENIVIAAKERGLNSKVELFMKDKDYEFLSLHFQESSIEDKDDLFNYISVRQSTRNRYSEKTVSSEDLEQLSKSFDFPEIKLLVFKGNEEIEKLKPFIIEGSNRQFQNKKFVDELLSWTRFSKKEAKERGDGIWVSSMGIPNIGKFIGKLVMENFITPESEAKRWGKLINASAGLALFVANENNIWNWITLGRAFQRFALTATKLNISHAHMNMPCEEVEVRKKLANHLNIPNKNPLLLLRFGYSEKMPYSFRRELNEVIVQSC